MGKIRIPVGPASEIITEGKSCRMGFRANYL